MPWYCIGHIYIKNYVLFIWNSALTGQPVFCLLNQETLPSGHTCKTEGIDSMASKAGKPQDKAGCGSMPYLGVIPALS